MKKISSLFALLMLLLSQIASGQNFEIYVSDAGNFNSPPWQISKFDQNGENAEAFINEELAWPQDILFLGEQNSVLISNLSSGRITKHHGDTGSFIEDFATGISGPTRMKIGADSLLYVLQWSGNGKVLRYQLDGTLVDEFTDIGVAQSIGIDWDSEGNLYVSSYNGDHVRKFDANGNDMGLFVQANLLGPTNIWFDDAGDLLVVDYNGTAVKRFDSEGNYVSDFLQGLSNAEGVDFLPNGNILVGNGATNSVKMYDSEGNYIDDFIASGAGGLLTPNAVVVRTITAVGIAEPASQAVLMLNSVGRAFGVTPSAVQQIEKVEIYNLSGVLLEQNKPTNSMIWDANDYPKGVYLISIQLTNGNISKHKVMVK